jgi:uncharacterized repeat protein (TIGR02543 family)
MTVQWSGNKAINYNEAYAVGVDAYTIAENNYQQTIRVDVYVSMWLYASSTYNVYVNTGIHTTTKELSVALRDGLNQKVATYDLTLTKINDYGFNAYCRAYASIAGAGGGATDTVGYDVSVAQGYWHYVNFDANGGTGAPATQVKYYGYPIWLSSTKPTRENYDFTGWKNTVTGEVTQAGDMYGYDMRGTNTLVAQWQIIHKPPSVSIQQPYRVASETSTAEAPQGTYVRVPVTWTCDQTGYSSVTYKSLTATVTANGSTKVTSITYSGASSGKTGTRYVVFPLATTSYATISVTVTETATGASGDAVTYSTVATAYIGKAHVPLDVANKGGSVGILSIAPDEGGISLGNLTLAGVNGQSDVDFAMSRLLGILEASTKKYQITLSNTASGMYMIANQCIAGVWLCGNSTGSSWSTGGTVCKITTQTKFADTGNIFIRGFFHGVQSGIYVAYGTDGHTLTVTTEQAPSVGSGQTVSALIPCTWTV